MDFCCTSSLRGHKYLIFWCIWLNLSHPSFPHPSRTLIFSEGSQFHCCEGWARLRHVDSPSEMITHPTEPQIVAAWLELIERNCSTTPGYQRRPIIAKHSINSYISSRCLPPPPHAQISFLVNPLKTAYEVLIDFVLSYKVKIQYLSFYIKISLFFWYAGHEIFFS